jgi:15,16-dihydrobiliverdin:ferredoxin oxidoreductase
MRMDLERAEVTFATARLSLDRLLRETSATSPSHQPLSLEEVQARHMMPWTSSIDPSYQDEELLYMKFWEWQTGFMAENLTNLQVLDCRHGDTDFAYRENPAKKARIVSLCLSSSEYRKIRLTYYDAGDSAQVFNAVFYPDPKYNLPILGVDVLAFNRKKYLAIVDFQPIHEPESDHAEPFEHLLQPIKERYDNLKGRMSSKFYDETKFFSQQMLFSRFEDESIIHRELFPAFTEYVSAHLALIRDTAPARSADAQRAVMERQRAYDCYSAERDPATGLFAAMFGNEWAQGFVHDFLFSLSYRPEKSSVKNQSSGSTSGTSSGAPSPLSSGHTATHLPQRAHSPAFVQR